MCSSCGETSELQVHHITYEWLFAEENHLDSLITLCNNCHELEHLTKKLFKSLHKRNRL